MPLNNFYSIRCLSLTLFLTTLHGVHANVIHISFYIPLDTVAPDVELDTVEVSDRANDFGGLVRIPKAMIDRGLSFAGDPVIQLLATLPEVTIQSGLSSKFAVNGESYDDNGIFIDDFPIFSNTLVRSTLQDGLSPIHEGMISDIQFSAGSFGADYGFHKGSIMAVKYDLPDKTNISANMSLTKQSVSFGMRTERNFMVVGARVLSNQLLLNKQELNAEVSPMYTDIQLMDHYFFNPHNELTLYGSFSTNQYNFSPTSRTSSVGNAQQGEVNILYSGDDQSMFRFSNIGAKYSHFGEHWSIKAGGTLFLSAEEEKKDIVASYKIIDNDGQFSSLLLSGFAPDATSYSNVNNRLSALVSSVFLKGKQTLDRHLIEWGFESRFHRYDTRVAEWEYIDSSEYLLPYTPFDRNVSTSLEAVINADTAFSHHVFSAYGQYHYMWSFSHFDVRLRGGLRVFYQTINKVVDAAPRVNLSFEFDKNKSRLDLSAGVYHQLPAFKEFIGTKTGFNPDVRPQRATKVGLSYVQPFVLRNSILRFSSGVDYNYVTDNHPYILNELRIRYTGNNDADAQHLTIKALVEGEFVPGRPSWFSVSINRSNTILKDGRVVPTPTHQWFKTSFLFEDYLPLIPNITIQMNAIYQSGLPALLPFQNSISDLRLPAFRRVDMGISYILRSIRGGHVAKFFKQVSFGVQVFNIFDFKNSVSNTWVFDLTSGNDIAIPNVLTRRFFNLNFRFEL